MTTAKKKKGLFKKYNEMERKQILFVYLILLFPMIQIAVMYFYVNFSSILLAFQGSEGFTLGNFERVFTAFKEGLDGVGLNPALSLRNSVIIFVTSQGFTLTIGLLTTYMLTKHMIFSRFFRVIYSLPGLVGGVVFSSTMLTMYQYNGPVVSVLQSVGIDLPMVILEQGLLGNDATAFGTLLFQNIFFGLAGGGMVLAGAFMRIPQEVFEAAKLDGCGFFRETFQLAIPCVWPTISTLFLFALCGVFTGDLSFYLYSHGTGSYGMTSVGFYLYKYQTLFSEQNATFHYGYLSAFGVLITLMTLPLTLLGTWAAGKFGQDVEF